MVSSIDEIITFKDFFFDAVEERVGTAIERPKIEFVGVQTRDEQHEYYKLREKIDEDNYDEKDVKRFKELSKKLPPNVGARHFTVKNVCEFPDVENGNQTNYVTIGHEFLHAVRASTAPIPELLKGYNDIYQHLKSFPPQGYKYIDARTIEFFAELSPIVIRDIMKDDKRFTKAVEAAEEAYAFQKKVSIKGLRQLSKRMEANPEKGMIKLLELLEQTYTCEKDQRKEAISTMAEFEKEFVNYHRRILKNPFSNELTVEFFTMGSRFPSVAKQMIDGYHGNSLSQETSAVYNDVNTAIGTYGRKLERRWPTILTRKPETIDKKYINPIMKSIGKIARITEKNASRNYYKPLLEKLEVRVEDLDMEHLLNMCERSKKYDSK